MSPEHDQKPKHEIEKPAVVLKKVEVNEWPLIIITTITDKLIQQETSIKLAVELIEHGLSLNELRKNRKYIESIIKNTNSIDKYLKVVRYILVNFQNDPDMLIPIDISRKNAPCIALDHESLKGVHALVDKEDQVS